jgi:hypothetical protein
VALSIPHSAHCQLTMMSLGERIWSAKVVALIDAMAGKSAQLCGKALRAWALRRCDPRLKEEAPGSVWQMLARCGYIARLIMAWIVWSSMTWMISAAVHETSPVSLHANAVIFCTVSPTKETSPNCSPLPRFLQEIYTESISEDPASFDLWMRAGRALQQRYQEFAIDSFQTASRLNPLDSVGITIFTYCIMYLECVRQKHTHEHLLYAQPVYYETIQAHMFHVYYDYIRVQHLHTQCAGKETIHTHTCLTFTMPHICTYIAYTCSICT